MNNLPKPNMKLQQRKLYKYQYKILLKQRKHTFRTKLFSFLLKIWSIFVLLNFSTSSLESEKVSRHISAVLGMFVLLSHFIVKCFSIPKLHVRANCSIFSNTCICEILHDCRPNRQDCKIHLRSFSTTRSLLNLHDAKELQKVRKLQSQAIFYEIRQLAEKITFLLTRINGPLNENCNENCKSSNSLQNQTSRHGKGHNGLGNAARKNYKKEPTLKRMTQGHKFPIRAEELEENLESTYIHLPDSTSLQVCNANSGCKQNKLDRAFLQVELKQDSTQKGVKMLCLPDFGNRAKCMISLKIYHKLLSKTKNKSKLALEPYKENISTAKSQDFMHVKGILKQNIVLSFANGKVLYSCKPLVVKDLHLPCLLSLSDLSKLHAELKPAEHAVVFKSKTAKVLLKLKAFPYKKAAVYFMYNEKIPSLHEYITSARIVGHDIMGKEAIIAATQNFAKKHALLSVSSIDKIRDNNTVHIRLMNLNTHPVNVKAGIQFGYAKVSNTLDDINNIQRFKNINALSKLKMQKKRALMDQITAKPPPLPKRVEHETFVQRQKRFRKQLKLDEATFRHLTEKQKKQILNLCESYQDIIARDTHDTGKSKYEFDLKTEPGKTVSAKTRPLPPNLKSHLKSTLQIWESKGIVQRAQDSSPFSSPLVPVPRKGGSVRFCVDYRDLNKISRKDVRPVPNCAEKLASLKVKTKEPLRWFAAFDLMDAFHNVPLSAEARKKTAITTPFGLYEFLRMPFGLASAPSEFSQLIYLIEEWIERKDPLSYLILLYFDDCLCSAPTFDKLLHVIELFFKAIRHFNLKLNFEKCQIGMQSVTWLGHEISGDGIKPASSHTDEIKNWKVPTSVDELRSFFGTISYYRKFCPNFAGATENLRHLLKKDVAFHWTPRHDREFNNVKAMLTSKPILGHPDFTETAEPFILYIDSSKTGVGAVLSQEQTRKEGKSTITEEVVISYASRPLTSGESHYGSYKKELLGMVYAVNHFRFYLLGKPFIIRTDHMALKWLMKTTNTNVPAIFYRWQDLLGEYDFEIEYVPGKQMQHVDGLSRKAYNYKEKGTIKDLPNLPLQAQAQTDSSDDFWIPVLKEKAKAIPVKGTRAPKTLVERVKKSVGLNKTVAALNRPSRIRKPVVKYQAGMPNKTVFFSPVKYRQKNRKMTTNDDLFIETPNLDTPEPSPDPNFNIFEDIERESTPVDEESMKLYLDDSEEEPAEEILSQLITQNEDLQDYILGKKGTTGDDLTFVELVEESNEHTPFVPPDGPLPTAESIPQAKDFNEKPHWDLLYNIKLSHAQEFFRQFADSRNATDLLTQLMIDDLYDGFDCAPPFDIESQFLSWTPQMKKEFLPNATQMANNVPAILNSPSLTRVQKQDPFINAFIDFRLAYPSRPKQPDFQNYFRGRGVLTSLNEKEILPKVNSYWVYYDKLHVEPVNQSLRFARDMDESEGAGIRAVYVLPESQWQAAFNMSHLHSTELHNGALKTYLMLSLRFWWPRMLATVKDWVNQCQLCQDCKRKRPDNKSILGTVTARGYPRLRHWSCDIVAFPAAIGTGYRYLFTMLDLATRWLEAYPLLQADAPTLGEELNQQFYPRYGIGCTLITDQAKVFLSSLIAEVCRLYNYYLHHCTPYNPKSNPVERVHRELNSKVHICLIAQDLPETHWYKVLPNVLTSYRNSPSTLYGLSPHFLVYFSHPLASMDMYFGTSISGFEQPTKEGLHAYETARNAVRAAEKKVLDATIKKHNENRKHEADRVMTMYLPGDQVQLWRPYDSYVPKELFPGQKSKDFHNKKKKFTRHWSGPYTVLYHKPKRPHEVVIGIKNKEGKFTRYIPAHYDHLRRHTDSHYQYWRKHFGGIEPLAPPLMAADDPKELRFLATKENFDLKDVPLLALQQCNKPNPWVDPVLLKRAGMGKKQTEMFFLNHEEMKKIPLHKYTPQQQQWVDLYYKIKESEEERLRQEAKKQVQSVPASLYFPSSTEEQKLPDPPEENDEVEILPQPDVSPPHPMGAIPGTSSGKGRLPPFYSQGRGQNRRVVTEEPEGLPLHKKYMQNVSKMTPEKDDAPMASSTPQSMNQEVASRKQSQSMPSAISYRDVTHMGLEEDQSRPNIIIHRTFTEDEEMADVELSPGPSVPTRPSVQMETEELPSLPSPRPSTSLPLMPRHEDPSSPSPQPQQHTPIRKSTIVEPPNIKELCSKWTHHLQSYQTLPILDYVPEGMHSSKCLPVKQYEKIVDAYNQVVSRHRHALLKRFGSSEETAIYRNFPLLVLNKYRVFPAHLEGEKEYHQHFPQLLEHRQKNDPIPLYAMIRARPTLPLPSEAYHTSKTAREKRKMIPSQYDPQAAAETFRIAFSLDRRPAPRFVPEEFGALTAQPCLTLPDYASYINQLNTATLAQRRRVQGSRVLTAKEKHRLEEQYPLYELNSLDPHLPAVEANQLPYECQHPDEYVQLLEDRDRTLTHKETSVQQDKSATESEATKREQVLEIVEARKQAYKDLQEKIQWQKHTELVKETAEKQTVESEKSKSTSQATSTEKTPSSASKSISKPPPVPSKTPSTPPLPPLPPKPSKDAEKRKREDLSSTFGSKPSPKAPRKDEDTPVERLSLSPSASEATDTSTSSSASSVNTVHTARKGKGKGKKSVKMKRLLVYSNALPTVQEEN